MSWPSAACVTPPPLSRSFFFFRLSTRGALGTEMTSVQDFKVVLLGSQSAWEAEARERERGGDKQTPHTPPLSLFLSRRRRENLTRDAIRRGLICREGAEYHRRVVLYT